MKCWAPDCQHYNIRETCKFFRVPKEPRIRRQWKKNARRSEEPGPGATLCSCHFVDGKKENGPTMFNYNKHTLFMFSSPEKRARRCRKEIHTAEADGMSHTSDQEPVASTSAMEGPVGLTWNMEQPVASTSVQEEPVGLTWAMEQPVASTSVQEEPVGLTWAMEQPVASTSVKEEPVGLTWAMEQPVASTSVQEEPVASTSAVPSTSMNRALIDAENYFLKKKVDELSTAVATTFSYQFIRSSDKLVLLYTGLPSDAIFQILFNYLKDVEINYYFHWKVEKVSKEDQLLLTLMKLRQNFPHQDLAVRFRISQAMVSNIVLTWIHVLHENVYKILMKDIPSRHKNKTCLPSSFSTFTNCRIIIDCTEITTAVQRNSMKTQRLTFSSYKHKNTWKILIGVAPNGVITYVSSLYPGSTSDKKIVKDCGILSKMDPGDLILADKGFLIRDILPPGVSVNIPPFLVTPQFTPEQIRQTETIARARIHVERAIRRIKEFKILHFIPHSLLQHAGVVCQVVAVLTNFQHTLLKEVEHLL